MDFYSKLVRRINEGKHFASYNHIRITRVEQDYAEGELDIAPESLNPMGIVHGGGLAALADTVAGTAAFSRGRVCVTLNCSIHYLAPGRGGKIKCVARAQKVGKTISVYEAVLTDEESNTVATGTFTFFSKEEVVFLPE